jgi:uncharacterized tellurite resistance protein B-like protein
MMVFSDDPQVAEQQMHAIIFYLTTFGYIDGDFDLSEKQYVRDYIHEVITHRVETARGDFDDALKRELISKYTTHFHEVFGEIDNGVRQLFTEAVAKDEDQETFVYQKLKLRCFEIFRGFDETNQKNLLGTVDELIHADGTVHPAEEKFRTELYALLEKEVPLDEGDISEVAPAAVEVSEPATPEPRVENHPFFERLEHHYAADPEAIKTQAAADLQLLHMATAKFDEQRQGGAGKLAGHHNVADFAGQPEFLDGHVYVCQPPPGREVELIVLGDLHGCYSCLKAALMQSDFFAKVQAFKTDPRKNPEPKLVLLGDYIDRGQYSFNGVLRTVLQLFLTVPEHIYLLRGNHEYYVEYKGRIYGGVRPAEAISTLEPYVPQEMFAEYMKFFESMPNMLIFDKTLFVHAGIPRDSLVSERWKDLSSLNDPDIRFQMMWSDPSEADFIPDELQQKNARFPFGRLQFRSFMARLGTNTMVRGHEKVDAGFKKVYDDGVTLLFNLFSAGGKNNDDLPPESSYRSVTPMAATIRFKDGKHTVTPWALDYERYNSPERNAFFKMPPAIEFRASQT